MTDPLLFLPIWIWQDHLIFATPKGIRNITNIDKLKLSTSTSERKINKPITTTTNHSINYQLHDLGTIKLLPIKSSTFLQQRTSISPYSLENFNSDSSVTSTQDSRTTYTNEARSFTKQQRLQSTMVSHSPFPDVVYQSIIDITQFTHTLNQYEYIHQYLESSNKTNTQENITTTPLTNIPTTNFPSNEYSNSSLLQPMY